jgi:hypothetical protein
LIDTSLSGTVEDLAQAILSRKAKFGLQYPIEFFEVALSDKYGVIQMFSVDLPPMSKKEFVNHVLTPRKEVVIHPVPQVCADGIHPWGRLQRRSMIEPLNWPVYVFTVANSIWYIESQIRNQFEQYCDKEGLTPTSAKQMTEGAPDAAVRPFVFDATQQAAV